MTNFSVLGNASDFNSLAANVILLCKEIVNLAIKLLAINSIINLLV